MERISCLLPGHHRAERRGDSRFDYLVPDGAQRSWTDL
jgi:hypothetical protein